MQFYQSPQCLYDPSRGQSERGTIRQHPQAGASAGSALAACLYQNAAEIFPCFLSFILETHFDSAFHILRIMINVNVLILHLPDL